MKAISHNNYRERDPDKVQGVLSGNKRAASRQPQLNGLSVPAKQPLTPGRIRALQRTIGNQATMRLIQRNSAGSIQRQAAPSSAGSGADSGNNLSPSRYRIRVVGHASPRWRHPGSSDAEQKNFELSTRRAQAVEDALRSLFQNRDIPVEFEMSSVVKDADTNTLDVNSKGMQDTLGEAGGDLDSDDPQLRRVDIEIDVLETDIDLGGSTELVTLPTATTRWEIKAEIVEGAAGAALLKGQGELRNRDTGQSVKGSWMGYGGGGGIDLPIPSVSSSGWKRFRTTSPVTFESFKGSPVRVTSFAIGLAFGYGWVKLTFVDLMDSPVKLNGATFNQWGAGGSVTSGPWSFTEEIPDPPQEAQEQAIAYETPVGSQYGLRVLFDTGKDIIPDSQLDALSNLVDRLP